MNSSAVKTSGLDESSASNLDVLSADVERVRAAASALLNKAESSSSLADMAIAVEKAAGAVKLVVDIGKARTELAKVDQELAKLTYENRTVSRRERSDRIRDYITFFTPLVTIVTLAATLGFQAWQFRKSEIDRREEALDAQWREAEEAISHSGALSPGLVALQPFLHSPKYGERARELAVSLLSNTSDSTFFTSLFGPALTPITSSNLENLLRVDRRLRVRVKPLDDKTWDDSKKTNDRARLSKDDLAAYRYILDDALPQITAEMGSFLKTLSSSAAPGIHLDLSNTEFTNGDWQNVILKGVNLDNAEIAWTNLRDTQLDVTEFNGLYPYGTAWWEAKSINPEFLEYLITNYPLQVGRAYGPRDEIKSQESYDAAIRRLRSEAAHR
jgi:hypothetical protein